MPAQSAQTVRSFDLPSAEFIFGSTTGMCEIREKIHRALHDDLPVLIEGENGTGKEVIGRFLHSYSVRRDGPFLKLNCAAVPPSLLEREIYGYDGGAVVNACGTANGSIGLASGGTIFLDEIGDMDLTLQKKLTETLGGGYYLPLGGREELVVNARFVFASSVDLGTGLKNRTFLGELLGFFAHHHVRLLPLRDRKEDIPQLCEYLLGKIARDFGRPVPRLSSAALEAFQQRKWPGNIRELENWIARIVVFGAEEVMSLEFRRELMTWEEPRQRKRHAAHLSRGRARRPRRHN